MKVSVEAWAPRAAARRLVEQANAIIAEYEDDGYDLTLRQLYYQFVSRDLLANRQTEYKRLGDIISRARRAGMISWDAITDRTRDLRGFSSWESPQQIIDGSARCFRLDPWEQQSWRVEVWFEKDALLGVFERACAKFRIPYFSCRGYTSDSEVWVAARRFSESDTHGRGLRILHFGDHDPSGIDMTRDITDRLLLFGAPVEVIRVALTMEQVEEYNPPPNPAKDTDSRFAEYQLRFGDESWELDALDPRTLAGLVDQHVSLVIDEEAWAKTMILEEEAREDLTRVARHFPALAASALKMEQRATSTPRRRRI